MRVIVAMVVALGVVTLHAAPRTIRGEVVDVQCALEDAANRGDEHADCALSCARRGAMMGIYTGDGVYTIAGDYTRDNNKRLLPFVGRIVEATGEITETDDAKVIHVTSIDNAH